MTVDELKRSFTSDTEFVLYKDGQCVGAMPYEALHDTIFLNQNVKAFKAFCFKVTIKVELE